MMSGNTLKSESIVPNDKTHWLSLRAQDITSTEVSALFGLSPYTTKFELWHRKKSGEIVSLQANERVKWGSRLEASIAKGIAEDQGWNIRRMDEYMRISPLRLGASFDYSIAEESILEVKNVDSLAFRDGWLVEEDDVQAPPHIEMQCQVQLLVSGRKKAYIGALIGGNRVQLIERVPDAAVFDQIKVKVQEFWDSIDRGQCPEPDFIRDAEFISELYKHATPGSVLNAHDNLAIFDLACEYKKLGSSMMEAKEKREGVRAKLLTLMGPAEKVQRARFKISAKTIAGGPVSFTREPYRDFRITWEKPKP